jgi:CheY-like chemotaxis protein
MKYASSHREEDRSAAKPTVLAVEDVILVRLLVADYLRDCGFAVIEAASADEAILILSSDISVDVVFADVNMPGSVDGFGLAKWVSEQRPEIRIVLGSGVAETAEKAAALCHEGTIVSKPYDLPKLERQLRDALGQGR